MDEMLQYTLNILPGDGRNWGGAVLTEFFHLHSKDRKLMAYKGVKGRQLLLHSAYGSFHSSII